MIVNKKLEEDVYVVYSRAIKNKSCLQDGAFTNIFNDFDMHAQLLSCWLKERVYHRLVLINV